MAMQMDVCVFRTGGKMGTTQRLSGVRFLTHGAGGGQFRALSSGPHVIPITTRVLGRERPEPVVLVSIEVDQHR